MCACGKPTINGQPGYSWDGKERFTHPIHMPPLEDGDELLLEEPGRCGGIDAHCTDLRLVRRYGILYLLSNKRDGRVRLHQHDQKWFLQLLESLDSNSRYWLLHDILWTVNSTAEREQAAANSKWASAIVQKRIRRKTRRGLVSVWIEGGTIYDRATSRSRKPA